MYREIGRPGDRTGSLGTVGQGRVGARGERGDRGDRGNRQSPDWERGCVCHSALVLLWPVASIDVVQSSGVSGLGGCGCHYMRSHGAPRILVHFGVSCFECPELVIGSRGLPWRPQPW